MTESIPNPLNDEGVKRDIEMKVGKLINSNHGKFNILERMIYLVTCAAQWGISEGFRRGWKLGQEQAVKQMKSSNCTTKPTKTTKQ